MKQQNIFKVIKHVPENLKWLEDHLFELEPVEPLVGIYFLFKESELIYIGKSTNLISRLNDHTNNKDYDQVFFFPVCPKGEYILEQLEKDLIRLYCPILNRQFNDGTSVPKWQIETNVSVAIYGKQIGPPGPLRSKQLRHVQEQRKEFMRKAKRDYEHRLFGEIESKVQQEIADKYEYAIETLKDQIDHLIKVRNFKEQGKELSSVPSEPIPDLIA